MSGLELALSVSELVFVSAVVGLIAQRVLPEKFTTGGSRDMAGAIVGLITLLLALVLGLLIWTAFGVFSSQKAAVQQLAINVLRIDNDLHLYGDDAAPGRLLLRDLARRGIEHVWSADSDIAMGYVHALSSGETMIDYLESLQPATDKQRNARADGVAAAGALLQTRLQMALALNDPLSYPLLFIVIAWAMFLFFGYGLLSKGTITAYCMAALGALAVGSAVYAIADLSTPYNGVFRVSPQPIQDALRVVDTLSARAGAHR